MFSDPLEGTGCTRDEAHRAVGRQRSLENDIRKLKRRRNALEDAGLDIGNTEALIRERQAELRAHIAENSAILRRERWREQVAPNKADTMRADDVFIPRSLSASAKPINVRMSDGTMARLSEGAKITGAKVIADKGVKRNIDDIDYLVCRHGGKRGGWQKKRGTAFVDDLGISRKCEIHWYEEESVGAVEHKLKKILLLDHESKVYRTDNHYGTRPWGRVRSRIHRMRLVPDNRQVEGRLPISSRCFRRHRKVPDTAGNTSDKRTGLRLTSPRVCEGFILVGRQYQHAVDSFLVHPLFTNAAASVIA